MQYPIAVMLTVNVMRDSLWTNQLSKAYRVTLNLLF